MNIEQLVFVGIKRQVLALDQSTGSIVWKATLKAAIFDDFTNVFIDRDALFASAGGRLYCLDPATGRVKWENPLKGCGYGIATLASINGSSVNAALAAEMRNRQRQSGSDQVR